MADKSQNLIFWVIVISIIILIIGIILFVIVDHFDRSATPSQLQRTVGGACQTDKNCLPGLSCLNFICMAPSTSTGNIGDNCKSNNNCLSSLTCQNSVCKAKIGAPCNLLSDCVSSATACDTVSHTCTNLPLSLMVAPLNPSVSASAPVGSGVTLNNLPNISNISNISNLSNLSLSGYHRRAMARSRNPSVSGSYCLSNSECSSGLCSDSKLIADVNGGFKSVHRFSRSLMDVIQEGDNTLMLLGDGNIMREVYSSNGSRRLEMIKGDHKIEQFASLGSNVSNNVILCGLSQGRLYQMDTNTSTQNSWKWELSSWAPSGITHISHSHDGNYLWIQFPIKFSSPRLLTSYSKKPTQYGHLYRFIGTSESPVLVKQSLLPWGIVRIYGRNDVCYLEVNQITRRAIRYPKGDTIRDFHLGLLMPNGEVYKIGTKNNLEIRNVKLIRGVPHLITHRQCASTLNDSPYTNLAISPISENFKFATEWVI